MNEDIDAVWERFVHATNPFEATRIESIWQDIYDTPQLSAGYLAKLLRVYGTVAKSHASKGVLIWGQAGVGKSHLLNRFRRVLHEQGPSLIFQVQPLRGSRDTWRSHIFRSMLTDLRQETGVKGVQSTQADHLLQMVLPTLDWNKSLTEQTSYIRHEFTRTCRALADGLARPVSPDFLTAFTYFLMAQCRAKHLSGEPSKRVWNDRYIHCAMKWFWEYDLDEEEQNLIRVHRPFVDAACEDSEDVYFDGLRLIGELAQQTTPIVLVFDQLETLSETASTAFARATADIVNSLPNYLILSAGVRDTIQSWVEDRTWPNSCFDRIGDIQLSLTPPNPAIYRDVAADRVGELLRPEDRQLNPAFQMDGGLFPFVERTLDEITAGAGLKPTPRNVIVSLRDYFEECRDAALAQGSSWMSAWPNVEPLTSAPQATELEPEHIVRFLEERLQEKQTALTTTQAGLNIPLDDAQTEGILQELFTNGTDERTFEVFPIAPKGWNAGFALRRPAEDTGASIGVLCCSKNSPTLVAQLKRMTAHIDKKPQPAIHFLLLRDSRAPIKESWKKSLELKQALERNGALTLLPLESETRVFLAGLGETLQSVKAGDFEIQTGGFFSRKLTTQDWRLFAGRSGIFSKAPLSVITDMLNGGAPGPSSTAPVTNVTEQSTVTPAAPTRSEIQQCVISQLQRAKLMNKDKLLDFCAEHFKLTSGNLGSAFWPALSALEASKDILISGRIVKRAIKKS